MLYIVQMLGSPSQVGSCKRRSKPMLEQFVSGEQNRALERLLTYQEAAEILSVKPQTLRQWVCYKRIPYVKIGSAVRLKPTQIQEFINESSR